MRLSELKKLNDKELYTQWIHSLFPFESAACGCCLTWHGFLSAGCPAHPELSRQVKALGDITKGPTEDFLRKNLDELYALRLFYADIYRKPVPAYVLEEEETKELQEICT